MTKKQMKTLAEKLASLETAIQNGDENSKQEMLKVQNSLAEVGIDDLVKLDLMIQEIIGKAKK